MKPGAVKTEIWSKAHEATIGVLGSAPKGVRGLYDRLIKQVRSRRGRARASCRCIVTHARKHARTHASTHARTKARRTHARTHAD